ncbi:MAG: type II secretion system protein GspD, partial [Xanthomonadales bacterium]|nr:type II secretion system protein GspD [Xanthomonadales bacterium]
RLRALISHLDVPLEREGDIHVVYLRYANAKELVPVLTGIGQSVAQEEAQRGAPGAQPGAAPAAQARAGRGNLNFDIQAD